jgi:hypothetical protein
MCYIDGRKNKYSVEEVLYRSGEEGATFGSLTEGRAVLASRLGTGEEIWRDAKTSYSKS